jgi:hypothetical protein
MIRAFFLLFIIQLSVLGVLANDDVELNLELEAKTKYVWRAVYVGPEPFVLNPFARVSFKGFSASVWANMDPDPGRPTVNELDYTFSYTKEFGSFGFEPALIYYAYPAVPDPVSADISMKLFYVISDRFTVYNTHYLSIFGRYGYQNNAYYVDLGCQYTEKLMERFWLQTKLSFALASPRFNIINAGVGTGGLENMVLDVQAPYYLNDSLYLRPRLTMSTILMRSVRDVLSPKQRTTNLVACFAVGADI